MKKDYKERLCYLLSILVSIIIILLMRFDPYGIIRGIFTLLGIGTAIVLIVIFFDWLLLGD